MTKPLTFIAVSLAFAVSACAQPEEPTPPAAEQEATPALVQSSGAVFAVTPAENAITIQHEPIPEYDMPAMTMEFTVADPAQLEGLAEGDRVTFTTRGLDIESIEEVAAE